MTKLHIFQRAYSKRKNRDHSNLEEVKNDNSETKIITVANSNLKPFPLADRKDYIPYYKD